MDTRPQISRYCRTQENLATDAGLSHAYVKHLARPNNARWAGPSARLLLARAFRRQAERLLRDADALEKGLVPPE